MTECFESSIFSSNDFKAQMFAYFSVGETF